MIAARIVSSKVSSMLDRWGKLVGRENLHIFAANLAHLSSQKAAIRFLTPPPQR